MSIACHNLTHVYQAGGPFRVEGIHDISLEIAAGESVGIIGPTGSGKSTLVQHFNGLLKPTSGTITVDGRDLWARGTDRRAVRLQVGLVFQYPEQQFFEESVAAEVGFGPRQIGLAGAEVDRRVRRSLERVGLAEDILQRSPFDLSGGQKRRLAIASVLAMEPGVLILDEPTAGLDPTGRRQVLDLVQQLHRRDGLTLILVSHNMDEVARLCRRVVVLEQGSLILDGPVRQVYSQAERLRAVGLEVPAATRLVQRLAGKGWPLPADVLTPEEAAEAVAGALGAGAASTAGTPEREPEDHV